MGIQNLYSRFTRMQAGAAGSADIADLVDTTSVFSQIPAIQTSTGASGVRVANGTGTLVSGTVVVATGLTSVVTFVATLIGTGATATGATEVERLVVASITTGAVTVNGSYHSGTAAVCVQSVSGTAAFHYVAVGT